MNQNEQNQTTEPTAPATPPEPVVLTYVGNGAYIAGVPATDLTASAIAASGLTIAQIKAYRNGAEPLYVDAAPASPALAGPVPPLTNDADGVDGANGEEQ